VAPGSLLVAALERVQGELRVRPVLLVRPFGETQTVQFAAGPTKPDALLEGDGLGGAKGVGVGVAGGASVDAGAHAT
jgi:hypothetical protein